MEFVFRPAGGPEIRDSCPDFEGHAQRTILEDGEVIAYFGRRWLVRCESGNPESYICTPADDHPWFDRPRDSTSQ